MDRRNFMLILISIPILSNIPHTNIIYKTITVPIGTSNIAMFGMTIPLDQNQNFNFPQFNKEISKIIKKYPNNKYCLYTFKDTNNTILNYFFTNMGE